MWKYILIFCCCFIIHIFITLPVYKMKSWNIHIATMLWPKLEGTKTFFYRIYNIHFKEPLARNAGDGQQTADWASVRWLELRVADGVSNTVKPSFNGEGHRWWKHGHYFGMSWSLLLRGQGAVGMADWGIKGSEDLGAERWVSSMCHPRASEIAELCSCQLLQQQIWMIRPSAPPETGINSTVQLDQNICKLELQTWLKKQQIYFI